MSLETSGQIVDTGTGRSDPHMHGARSGRGALAALGRRLDAFGPLAGLVAVFVFFAVIASPAFGSWYNVKTIVTQTVIIGIGAMGMTLIIISGGIDLSVGSTIALATVVVARVLGIESLGPAAPYIAIAAAAATGACVGLFNGAVSAGLRIVPFIVTLGAMQIARGMAKWIAREQTVLAPHTWLNGLMNVDPDPGWIVFAPGVWIFLLSTAVVWFVLKCMVFGRYVFALGSNENAARLCGVSIVRTRLAIYTLGGACAGLAGLMQFANLTVGDPTAAGGAELDIIAAVVIGGGSLKGGEGGAGGTLVGALLMASLRNGCNLVGIPNYIQNILIGAIIIGAVAMDRLKKQ